MSAWLKKERFLALADALEPTDPVLASRIRAEVNGQVGGVMATIWLPLRIIVT